MSAYQFRMIMCMLWVALLFLVDHIVPATIALLFAVAYCVGGVHAAWKERTP